MIWARSGAAISFVAVACGAFGAHGLKNRLSPELLAVWNTGAQYMMYHGLALFAVSYMADRAPGKAVNAAGYLFLAGIALFSGSLFALALTGERRLGAITPLGGLCLLGAWASLAFAAK